MNFRNFLVCALCAAPSFAGAQSGNPQIDMPTVQKWANVSVAHYHVEASFHQWTPVSKRWAGSEGEVTDSMTVDFDWDVNRRSLVGSATFANGTSSVAGMRSTLKECPASEIAGAYEHITVTSAAANAIGGVEMRGTRTYAPTKSPLECPASNALIATPGDEAETTLTLPVADPRMLGLSVTGDPRVTVTPDHKSFTIKGTDGWTWTMTPTIVK
ncbi:MAG TPA: hypothetical protein PKM48_00235 [Parvularculaceae bacterium]|nr:hypothetical protein [Parvularculaceae bacterium]